MAVCKRVPGENTKTYTDKKVKSKNGETYFYTVCAYKEMIKEPIIELERK